MLIPLLLNALLFQAIEPDCAPFPSWLGFQKLVDRG
jgi:hypothetical protein